MENINENNLEETIKTKPLIYKGKVKHIPLCNDDSKLCEFYIVARMRYCKFEKHQSSQFCIYHRPNPEEEILFVDCPIDSSHRVLKSKLKRHINVCNKLQDKQKLISNIWYKEKINKVKENQELIKEDLKSLNDLKWEELSDEEYSFTLDKIIQCYQILSKDYKEYSEKENLNEILNDINKNKKVDENLYQYDLSLSGMEINYEKDFNCTKDLIKSEKNGKQNQAIGNVITNFNLVDDDNLYIEFGAGKGGLSHYINTMTNDRSTHVLLERDGIRFKRDKYTDKLIRFRTDILDFDINYIDEHFQNNIEYNILGVAKHICGCAFDMSIRCLLNYEKKEFIKGVAMATCCHQLCMIEHLNNLDFYQNYLKLSTREITLLFKATSWIFGPIDIDSTKIKSSKIFKEKNLKKSYIGLISKYIVDLSRVFYLISQNFKVFYLKYCDNEITTENNLILALEK